MLTSAWRQVDELASQHRRRLSLMPRYKLRLVEGGQVIWCDDGTRLAVAATIDEARDLFEDYNGDRPMYLHSAIARHRIIYKRDVEDCDCHEGAEPGDTSFTLVTDTGDLAPCDVRVWLLGAPRLTSWRMTAVRRIVSADEIPVGTHVHHGRLGTGHTTAPARRIGGWWYLDVAWGWPTPTFEKVCKVSCLSVLPSHGWPPVVYELEIDGEVIAEGNERMMQTLLAAREARLRAEWEAEHFDETVLAERVR